MIPNRPEVDALLVSERFVSLQGEGVSQGKPAAFLRLGRCNLSCSFCDTPYTWDERAFDLEVELRWESFGALAAWVREASPGRLIVTGGEPLIQHKSLLRFVEFLDGEAPEPAAQQVVEVETNGTIAPPRALLERVDQWNVSPKLSGAGQDPNQALKRAALEVFAGVQHAFFKFVLTQESEVEEALSLMASLGVPKERVLFMPEARGLEALRARGPQVADWAVRHRVRYSSRLHLELFGGGRGV